jgi:hypothetical protein
MLRTFKGLGLTPPDVDLSYKNLPKELVAPGVEKLIQSSPQYSKLKPGSKDYQDLFQRFMNSLYQEGGGG